MNRGSYTRKMTSKRVCGVEVLENGVSFSISVQRGPVSVDDVRPHPENGVELSFSQ